MPDHVRLVAFLAVQLVATLFAREFGTRMFRVVSLNVSVQSILVVNPNWTVWTFDGSRVHLEVSM